MIALDSMTLRGNSLRRLPRTFTTSDTHALSNSKMSNFLVDLVTNLAILVTLLFVCHLLNLLQPQLALNGGYVFVLLGTSALVFDAALTFLVFADAPSRYGKFGDPGAFVQRAGAYAVTCVFALGCAQILRKRGKKAAMRDTLVIRTSPYTESHLPM